MNGLNVDFGLNIDSKKIILASNSSFSIKVATNPGFSIQDTVFASILAVEWEMWHEWKNVISLDISIHWLKWNTRAPCNTLH